MSKQRTSGQTKDANSISSKLLGAKVSDIKIQKFRDLTQYNKDKYQLGGKFSISILKIISNKFVPQVMFTIVLPNQAIHSIDPLSECQNLMILNLSRNCIENLSPLKKCKELKIVNLSDNSISQANDLGGCKHLVNLQLQKNHIRAFEHIKALKQCPSLKNLHLQNLSGQNENPICRGSEYRKDLFSSFSTLHRLDSIPREITIATGSQLKVSKKKDIKIELKSIGSFYTQKFPSLPAYSVPCFGGEGELKKSIHSCKMMMTDLENRLKALAV